MRRAAANLCKPVDGIRSASEIIPGERKRQGRSIYLRMACRVLKADFRFFFPFAAWHPLSPPSPEPSANSRKTIPGTQDKSQRTFEAIGKRKMLAGGATAMGQGVEGVVNTCGGVDRGCQQCIVRAIPENDAVRRAGTPSGQAMEL